MSGCGPETSGDSGFCSTWLGPDVGPCVLLCTEPPVHLQVKGSRSPSSHPILPVTCSWTEGRVNFERLFTFSAFMSYINSHPPSRVCCSESASGSQLPASNGFQICVFRHKLRPKWKWKSAVLEPLTQENREQGLGEVMDLVFINHGPDSWSL